MTSSVYWGERWRNLQLLMKRWKNYEKRIKIKRENRF